MSDIGIQVFSPRRPSFFSALMLYAAVMVLLILSSSFLGVYKVESGILISEWVFILIPCLIFLRLLRLKPTRDLRISALSLKSVIGVILTSIGGILLTGELVVLQNDILPIPTEYLDILRELFTISGKMPIYWAIFTFSISPAICEEILFRGIILQGALNRISPTRAIVVTGFLFGLFHLDPYRLLGTMVLGFIMSYIVVKTGSLLASMVYHFINNLLILLVMNSSPLKDVPWLTEEAHLPFGFLILSCLTFFTGIRLLHARERRSPLATQRSQSSETFQKVIRRISRLSARFK